MARRSARARLATTLACGIVPALSAGCMAARGGAERPLSTRIEDARFVSLGGIDQWITIRGDDVRRPILLLLHGGPGDVQSPYVSVYAPYERAFVLVQWDQRGAGKTFATYRDRTPDLSLERVAKDGIELAEYLRRRFKGNSIIVLGHSWGTVIGTKMVSARPDLFAAYVGTGQVASWAESAAAQFEFLKTKARETRNAAMMAQLDSIGTLDPTNAAQYFTATRPLRNFLGDADKAWFSRMRALTRDSLGMTDDDRTAVNEGMNFSGRTLLPTQMHEQLSTSSLRFELPYFVIQGQDDWFTPTDPARAYFDKVVAPRKRMVVLEGAGHFALVTHASAFIAALQSMLDGR
ncbi:MAG: alpha/beta fold hydrolase [Gemmatimonadaceae bacterium]